jgi:hypothetical protein
MPSVEASRTTLERFGSRFPAALWAALALLARLPPGSGLRRRVLKRFFALGFQAISRDDDALLVHAYEPGIQLRIVGPLPAALGLSPEYSGHPGIHQLSRDYRAEMAALVWTPEQLFDLGETIVVRVRNIARGRASGIETSQLQGFVYHLSPRGRIARQEIYWNWEEAARLLG